MTAGGEVTLRSDELDVVILPDAGGRIHRIRAFGEDVLRTPNDPATHEAEPFFWGAYVMAPWCNRARPGPMQLAGRRVDLEPNFPDGTAIHGLVSSARWDHVGPTALAVGVDAGASWPWAFEVRQAASVDGGALSLDYRLTNFDPEMPMPAGLGLHPWFRRPIELRIPARKAYAANTDSPREPVRASGDLDLGSPRSPAAGIDATLASLAEPVIDLVWRDRGVRARLEVETDAGAVLVALATPPDLDAIAVEPQTHGPDPLRRLALGEPDPPALLAPGASARLALRLSFARVDGGS